MNQLEVVGLRELNALHATRLLTLPYNVLLANDRKMRLVRQQTKHN